ncbi:hypothetical protein [Streptomyces albidoflavus]|uniref:hypothetical protein n=1 Tax=Streptomyces albidoflavus TaxID=1886 RepID=UPI000524D0AE|nr:hypothetical protein [Streptomyces albidoflavus]
MQPYSNTLTGHIADVDGTPLGTALMDTSGVHEGIDLVREGILLLASSPLPLDRVPTIIATLAGGTIDEPDIITAIGHLIARLTDASTNPALADLPEEQQKNVERQGAEALYRLTDPWLREPTSEAAALIDGI